MDTPLYITPRVRRLYREYKAAEALALAEELHRALNLKPWEAVWQPDIIKALDAVTNEPSSKIPSRHVR